MALGSQSHTENPRENDSLSEICSLVNLKCHAHIKKLIAQDAESPHLIENFEVDEFIDSIDPILWKAVCIITKSSSTKAIKRDSSHVRKVRRLFCICTLLFTINSQCSFPLHTLIADAVETCGGSNRLMRLLNRFGVCVSPETHARYLQYRNQKRKSEGPMAAFPNNTFMFVSADNLDFIHGYARVYCGEQQSSWHGTTIQIVHPQPHNLSSPTDMNVTVSMTDVTNSENEVFNILPDTLSKRPHLTLSPRKKTLTCSPCPKKKRRSRTGMEGGPGDEMDSLPSIDRVSTLREALEKPKMNITAFQLKSNENKALTEFKKMSTNYMLLKVASTTHENTLIDFTTYFSLSNQVPQPEQSNIIFFKVLDQRCDDKETLLNVINDMFVEFVQSGKKKFVLLEGDQATYERLQSIKALYGNDLSWMVPFPGDWHFLKNYQEVLLKIYLDAGLRDLAKASGYQPNSVDSNLKELTTFF